MNETPLFMKLSGSVAAAGFITGLVLTAVYLLQLPIFDLVGLSWCLFYALVACGIGLLALVARAIWSN